MPSPATKTLTGAVAFDALPTRHLTPYPGGMSVSPRRRAAEPTVHTVECGRCKGGKVLSADFGSVYDSNWGPDYVVVYVNEQREHRAGGSSYWQGPIFHAAFKSLRTDGNDPPRYRFTGQVFTTLGGAGDSPRAPADLQKLMPKHVVLLKEDLQTEAPGDHLLEFACRANARLCQRAFAGDERVLAHFPEYPRSEPTSDDA